MDHHPILFFDLFPTLKKLPLLAQHPHFVSYFMGTILVGIIFVFFAWRARASLRQKTYIIPDQKFSARNLAELLVEHGRLFLRSVIGKEADHYFPLLATLFLFILVSNLLGLIPGFAPPSANINVNLACSIIVFLYYNYRGVKVNGVAYIKHFMGPMLLLAPLMFAIELISHLVRPMSLSIRLFGNINGDHLVLEIFTELTKLLIPCLFISLGLLVSVIQALVFTLLSAIYISLSVAHDH